MHCAPPRMGCIVFVAGPHSERDTYIYTHPSLSALRVCVWPTVAINRVTRPFEKLSRRSRSRRATKTPWDHDLCPNFQRKVTALARIHRRSRVLVQSFLSAPPRVYCFEAHRAPTFCTGLRCTPRARFEDGLFKLESETKHTDTGNQGKWVSVGVWASIKTCTVSDFSDMIQKKIYMRLIIKSF